MIRQDPPELENLRTYEGRLGYETVRLANTVSETVSQWIAERRMEQSALARAMGLSRGRVSQILSGDENLTLRTLAGVSAALGAQFDIELSDHESFVDAHQLRDAVTELGRDAFLDVAAALPPGRLLKLLAKLPPDAASEVLSSEQAAELLDRLPSELLAELLSRLPAEVLADLLDRVVEAQPDHPSPEQGVLPPGIRHPHKGRRVTL